MFEERREATDHAPLIQRSCNLEKFIQRHARLGRTSRPRLRPNFLDREFALEGFENLPVERAELNDVRVDHVARHVALAAHLDCLAAHMANAKHEQSLRGHDSERLGADPLLQNLAVARHRKALWYLER